MVVLAAVVCTKAGKALMARQFVEITRVRLEGLLAAFPKLMGSGGKQHTFIETDSVRYVYQPLENLYMLLLTNKSSNILEDLETLHLLAKIVPEYCRILEEDEVLARAFELIAAFDEVIAVGYREKVTLQQIKTFMEMDSHEERIHEMVERDKEREAKIEADKRTAAIEKMRLQQQRSGGGGGYASVGSSGMSPMPAYTEARETQEPVVQKETRKPQQNLGSSGTGGLKLQKKEGSASRFMRDMEKEEGFPVGGTARKDSFQAVAVQNEPVNIDIIENVNVSMDNEGGLKSFEVKGDLNITINEAEYSRVTLNLNPAENKGFSFKAHPNINKPRFTKEKVIALNPSKAFPTGNALNVLKWRWVTSDESLIPLTVSCWPTPAGDGTTEINMEYELKNETFALGDVIITIPIPGAPPSVREVSNGTAEFDQRKRVLVWRMDLIDESTTTGSLEFTVPAPNEKGSAFMPIIINFVSRETFCDVTVVDVTNDEGEVVGFTQTKSLSADQYNVV
eukprot:TRINITY_DN1012_c0_g1_i1.p1 TRINITY_DN1012_c0_g1~~TRINITY_DN1012_c0_g1_i1.p1  ORF type:complete len:509 (-),score=113.75 TRINITY_DN1012_c0_g1_i1:83-1609(-)